MTYNIPGPKPWPIIGSAHLFVNINSSEDVLYTFNGLFHKYCAPARKILKVWFGPKLVIGVCSPKHVEAILSSEDALQKDKVYQLFGIIGNGVIIKNGQEWRDLRKPLDKLLTKKMVESNLEMFHDTALKVCKVISKHAEKGETFNIRRNLTDYGIDTLCASTFGYALNEVEKEENNFLDLFEKMRELTIKLVFRVLNHFSLLNANLSSDGRRLKKLAESFWKLIYKVIKQSIDDRKKLGEDVDAKPALYSDIIAQKATKDKLSWEETGRLATDFVFAGFDTSSVITSYIILMLAMYPEHQEKVYKEQLDILGEDPLVSPTPQQLSKMTYLTRIIKELIRLYSPPAIFRTLTNDLDLGDGIKLPKGCMALIAFMYLHRDPDIWSHPEEFYPDHFLPEEVAARPKGAYLPFSWGPRSCPGSIYAMTSIKVIVSALIRRYKFETDLTFDQLEYRYSLLMEVSQGYMVRIKSRY
ncbi:cytochrome P450 4g1-like isoform X2 [Rhodnius prolixus]